MSTFFYKLGRFAVRHRRAMLLGWVGVFVALAIGSQVANVETSESFTIPGTESQEAFDLLDERFPAQSGTSGQIVFATEDGSPLADSADAVNASLAEAASLEGVIMVTNPFETGTISQDGSIGYADVRYGIETTDVGIDGVELLEETGANRRVGRCAGRIRR